MYLMHLFKAVPMEPKLYLSFCYYKQDTLSELFLRSTHQLKIISLILNVPLHKFL